MPKPGTTVDTKIDFFTEDGVRKKKTTTTTTTVTETPEGGYKTSTSTRIQTEALPDSYDEVTQKVGKLTTKGSDTDSDDEKENQMSQSERETFRNDCLRQINDYRRNHGSVRLNRTYTLEKVAQKHANKMARKGKLSLLEGRHGQSLSMSKPRPTGDAVAKQWYDEKKEYNFSKAEFKKGTGNFTQIIWKESKDIGIGVACNEMGEAYIIALFDPPGNVHGQFAGNVKR